MDFSLDEETILLRNSAGQYLRENCPTSFVKKVVKEQTGFSRSMWKELADLGWLGLIYDERYGGIGGKFFDLFILFEEIGKVLLPSPFFCSAILSGLIINEAGDAKQKDEYLPPIIHGEKIFTMALLDEQGRYDFNSPKLEAKETKDGGYVIDGTRILVPYAHVADAILVLAELRGSSAGGPTIFRVDGQADGQKIVPLYVFTEEKTFAVIYEKVEVPPGNVIGALGKGNIYLNKIFPRAVILKCGEMLGGLERVIEMTVAYVKERHQFDQPLGSLQVVQHYCADMATFLETTRLITYQAASLLSEGIPCKKEVSMAKAWCSDVYKKCTWIGHQLHGGIGFIEEHDLHLYYKHAKVSELSFEDSWFHRSKVAEEMGIGHDSSV
jgi:alkylation response protein AidB-like acyl-CoA dehydrogenase